MAEELSEGVHVVALPFPLQGHMAPMLRLSHLLASRGITITFVHLQSNFSRLHFSHVQQASQLPPLRIRHVSLSGDLPGKPSSSASSTRNRVMASEKLQPSFSHLLAGLHASFNISCVIADALMSWALSVAAQMGILGASLFTGSLSSFASYCNIPLLASLGVFPIKDMDGGAQQALIRCIPGLPQIFRYADLPSFFHAPCWPDDVLDFITRQMKLMSKATWVLCNSASLEPETELEEEMRKSMPIISIGPLLACNGPLRNEEDEGIKSNHMDDSLSNEKDEATKSNNLDGVLSDGHDRPHIRSTTRHLGAHIRASLWREDTSCLEWLQRRPSSSVLYISFGSVVALSWLQIEEIVSGLEASRHPVLWALRPNSIKHNGEPNSQTLSTSLESDVMSRISKLGLVVSWAPQIEVLAHDSIGGFMTHCGWNSVMESIAMGKPMLGLPYFAEQRINCKLMEHWKVGKELQVGSHGLVDRHEVESCVSSIMDGTERNSLRNACAKLKFRLLHAITSKDGTSLKSLDRFVNELLERTG